MGENTKFGHQVIDRVRLCPVVSGFLGITTPSLPANLRTNTEPYDVEKRHGEKELLQTGMDPLLAHIMKAMGIPATRKQYLLLADLEEPLDAEIEAMLPEDIRETD